MTTNMFPDHTEEGQQMWNNIAQFEMPAVTINSRNNRPKSNFYEVELKELKRGIRKMIINSQNVIREADEIMSLYTTKEEYLTSEAKVFKTAHIKLIERLTKLLNGEEVFNYEIVLEEEIVDTLPPLYYAPKQNR